MVGWGKSSYRNINPVAARQRPYKFENAAAKRDVVATPEGWVKRATYTDTHGNQRIKNELLVTIHELDDHLGIATVLDAYAEQTGPNEGSLYLVYSEPITAGGRVNVSMAGANNHVMSSVSSVPNRISGANNTLRFVGAGMTAGDYTIVSNSISGATGRLQATSDGASANTSIHADVRTAAGVLTIS